MRHVVGFVVGLVVLTPLCLLGVGWAFRLVSAVAQGGGTLLAGSGLVGIAALCALALLLAVLLAAPRLTPLVPAVAGMALVGLTAAHLLRPELAERVPALPGVEGALSLLSLGLFLPVALALVVPMFLPSRWQSYRPRGAHAAGEEGDYLDAFYDDEPESGTDRAAAGRRRAERRSPAA
ncbi:hypothetical protein [Marinitenerispora sediminis]|uniref:Uncharacterized protein n=1 Tax=Marinitenerispora sediminis TaxID=1931232 RepID=A0A368TAT3_9ACTN|nr:hypothetical protein [Marinitenerispora sediminis]RCV47494.1 hypothetical protein DEF28_26135 [Marinitenerispora sediminis]RCV47770.1 hypothetical protein DEF23_26210 [Marinitenerispora sediminis]RCV62136.1 hypothetical protein DEF24_02005 [Marinitenerispora sediminis]